MENTGGTNSGSVSLYDGKLGMFNFTPTGTSDTYNAGLKATLSQNLSTLTFDDGIVYAFGTNNKISQISDRFGNHLSFTYDTNERLISVTDTLGRTITYTYASDGRLQSVVDPFGRTATLAYYMGESGGGIYDLKSVTVTSGSSTRLVSFTYDGYHDMTSQTNPNGSVYDTIQYDGNKRVASVQRGSSAGGTTSYVYTLSNGTVSSVSITNPRGATMVYAYDSNGNITSRTIGSIVYGYGYDSNGHLTGITYPRGNGISYEYDDQGNITQQQEHSDIGMNTTTYQYGAYDQPTDIVFPNGLEKTYTLSPDGKHILSESGSGMVLAQYVYNGGNGQLTQRIDADGNVTQYTYS